MGVWHWCEVSQREGRIMSRTGRRGLWLILAALFLFSGVTAAKEAPKLFDKKTDKKIKRINILKDDGSWIFLHNKKRLFMHDGNSGKLMWEAKIPKYTDDGLDLIWNEEVFITSMKKGMICFNLADGKVLWETDTNIKMKKYVDYFNFPTGFVVVLENEMVGFDPNTGEVKWRNDEDAFGLSSTLHEAGLPNVYSFERSYGNRLVLLGNKGVYIYNADDGTFLGSTEVKWANKLVKMAEKGHDVPEPLTHTGESMFAVFHKDGTVGMNLQTGEVVWQIEEAIDRKRGYLKFEYEGDDYALFAMKKKMMCFNLTTGAKKWETAEDVRLDPYTAELLDDGTLFVSGIRSFVTGRLQPWDMNGTYILAYGLDFGTGEAKWGPEVIVWSPNATIDFLGINPRMAHYQGPWIHGDEAVFYVFGVDARLPELGEKKWKQDGEGLMRINMKTGEVKYRTAFKMYDHWIKNVNPGAISPAHYDEAFGAVPEIIWGEDNSAYLAANNTVVKVDINTGETLWTGPDLEFVYSFNVAKGRVFGPIGSATWGYDANIDKLKAKDTLNKTKRVGYFMLDADTGEQFFAQESKKDPLHTFMNHYDPNSDAVYLSDERYLRRLNLSDGEFAWELDLKKELTGEFGAKKGVVFKLTGASSSTVYGYYSITTYTTKSYEVSMEHGPRWYGDQILVLANDGPAMVNLDGSIAWKTEWDWKNTKINYTPTIINDKLIYQFKKKLKCIDLATGKMLWEAKEAKDADIV
ncbi:PQQ-binding-like beta-propeller repeat protein, partial [bacterium]|nr:PQQ-binding-like beta-propeller repeat protein [bacterium]